MLPSRRQGRRRRISGMSSPPPVVSLPHVLAPLLTPSCHRVVFAGGEWEVEVLFDPQRTLFHAWGLGLSSAWYAVNPMTLWHTWKLGTDEGIW